MHRAREYGYSISAGNWYSDDDTNATGCNSPFVSLKNASGTSVNMTVKIGTSTTIYNDGVVYSP